MKNINLISKALAKAQAVADQKNAQVIEYNEISRHERELLVANGWLMEIIRGWYILIRPDVQKGETTVWYANFWDFIRIYLNNRFDNQYCLSAESSLDVHLENPIVPKQIIVAVNQGAGLRKLLHHTSLLLYKDEQAVATEVTKKAGINVKSLPYALCRVSPTFYQRHTRDAEIALRLIKNPDEITQVIIRHNLRTAASRLIGAYQHLNNHAMANSIKEGLAAIGIFITPHDPFKKSTTPLLSAERLNSPYVGRIRAMWEEARNVVIQHFPEPPGLPKKKVDYLKNLEDIYQNDAYNSLSIEGYRVTPELIEKVKRKSWNPDTNIYDNNIRNAMAAKGYYDAFQQVKKGIGDIINGTNAALIVRDNLQKWYRNLFGPAVQANIIPAESLFGYRNDRVYICNSRHSPPPKEAVLDSMEAFFDCLTAEPNPAVNAVLGHYFFVYIHPYMDGNGRLARFLMNSFLASGGFPWTIIHVKNRSKYISILEKTHSNFDLTDFTLFIKAEMENNGQVEIQL